MKMTEAEIQGLKAQDAKDLAVDLLRKLNLAQSQGAPLSPGQLQLQELQFQLRLREAEIADAREREAHECRVRELELKIQQERTRQADSERRADDIRQQYVSVLQRFDNTQQSLSVELERITREHAVRMEKLEADFAKRREMLESEQKELTDRRDSLSQQIEALTDIKAVADDLSELQDQISRRQNEAERKLKQLDEQYEAAEFERRKRVQKVRRDQEVELAELEVQHRKLVVQANLDAARKILADTGLVAVESAELQRLQALQSSAVERCDQELDDLRRRAQEELRRQFNITSPDPLDVTELFYRHRSLQEENAHLRSLTEKLEAEIRRMREHIEKESSRIAAAVEAAKVHVQNLIEPGVKR